MQGFFTNTKFSTFVSLTPKIDFYFFKMVRVVGANPSDGSSGLRIRLSLEGAVSISQVWVL